MHRIELGGKNFWNIDMSAFLEALRSAVGVDQVVTDVEAKHLGDYMMQVPASDGPLAVLLPRTTEDVAAILRVCSAHGVPAVPQGGLTGLAGGAVPIKGGVAISMQRMRRIEEVDAAASTMTVEAGVPLQAIQEAAEAAGLMFPLDIGSRGSCQIGGNISTNVGGNRVLRFGMARDLVLGFEAVLADGTILTSLNKMQKNNAGYDLKQLFIGSEGTLGVVTRLVLRLFPQPASSRIALVTLADYVGVLDLLVRAKAGLGGNLAAFEVMWPEFYELATTAHGVRPPLLRGAPLYVLLESLGADPDSDAARFDAMVEAALEAGVVTDAVIAQNMREGRELWALRDSVTEFSRSFFPAVGFDISIPIADMQRFVDEAKAALHARHQAIRAVWFGHIADSNLHINVKLEDDGPTAEEVSAIVYGRVREYGGSVSAEHGIGLLKRNYLGYTRSDAEIAVMRKIKAALDPQGLLNPGKVFSLG